MKSKTLDATFEVVPDMPSDHGFRLEVINGLPGRVVLDSSPPFIWMVDLAVYIRTNFGGKKIRILIEEIGDNSSKKQTITRVSK